MRLVVHTLERGFTTSVGVVYFILLLGWLLRLRLGIPKSLRRAWYLFPIVLTFMMALYCLLVGGLGFDRADVVTEIIGGIGFESWLLTRKQLGPRPSPLIGRDVIVVRGSSTGLRVRVDDDVWNASSEYGIPLRTGENVTIRRRFAFSLLVARSSVGGSASHG